MEIFATNAAGLTGSGSGQPLRILGDADGLSTVGLTFVVAGGIIFVALLMFLIGYLFFRRRSFNLPTSPYSLPFPLSLILVSLHCGHNGMELLMFLIRCFLYCGFGYPLPFLLEIFTL